MKKERTEQETRRRADEDTMRPEYDFSTAARGITSERYRQGTNVVVLDPDVACLFPDSSSVNDALRLLGEIVRKIPRPRKIRKHKASA